MRRILIAALAFLIWQVPVSIGAQIAVESSMDWGSGLFRVAARRGLDADMAPSDHPKALAAMEEELPDRIVAELGRLAWDRRGTLADLVRGRPEALATLEELARSMNREWSRLSADQRSVEAAYTLDLSILTAAMAPSDIREAPPEVPPGWIPTPEDGWTGIVVFVPSETPVRGTGLSESPRPALRARILSSELEVLADPADTGLFAYGTLDDRRQWEAAAGRRPYQVMARELYGRYPCDIILGEDDTRRLLAADSGRSALSEGRIVLLFEGALN